MISRLRLLFLVLLWLACLVVALAGGWALLWTLVYVLGLLVVGSFLWAHANVAGLAARRLRRTRHVQVGDTLTEQVTVETRPGPLRWWPRLWLEVRDGSDLPGHQLSRVISLGPRGRRDWEATSPCTRRGRYTLGPLWVESSDPFGLFHATRQLEPGEHLVVFPRAVPLGGLGRVPGELPGGAPQGARAPFNTPSVSTIRDYAPGDPFNRIHWASTARLDRLMVRDFELDPSADIWLVLDLEAEAQAGAGAESTEEYAVTTVASLARYFLDQGRSVGLVSQMATIPSDRGPRQLERLLEVLAVVRASSRLSLERLLSAETSRFTRGSTLVIVTSSTDEQWVGFCFTLRSRGIHTMAVLVEAMTFGPAPTSVLLVASLAAAGVPTYLVKRGEALTHALATPRSAAAHDG